VWVWAVCGRVTRWWQCVRARRCGGGERARGVLAWRCATSDAARLAWQHATRCAHARTHTCARTNQTRARLAAGGLQHPTPDGAGAQPSRAPLLSLLPPAPMVACCACLLPPNRPPSRLKLRTQRARLAACGDGVCRAALLLPCLRTGTRMRACVRWRGC
jgi:hypothetical protein